MKRPSKKIITRVGLGTLAVAGGAVGISRCGGPPPAVSVPGSIASNCSADVSTSLSNWLDTLPTGSTVNFPTNGCYRIDTSLDVQGTTGLTINGNGTTVKNTSVQPTGQTLPIIRLVQDVNIAIGGLKVTGQYDGTSGTGGPGYEGDYGLMMEADHGVTVTGMTMSNIQGDFVIFQATNQGDTGSDNSLTSGVSITSSTFTNCGYHGITAESVNGAKFSGDTFTNVNVDAMDFEVDVASTYYTTNNVPQEFGEDNVTITNDTFNSWGDDFFASLQGQTPGVQEHNLTITNNTLNSNSPLFEITGTNPFQSGADSRSLNTNLVVTGNHNSQNALSTHGVGTPGTESTMQLQYITGVNISNNTFPLDIGSQPGPYISALQAFALNGLTIKSNDFNGGYAILEPDSAGNTVTQECGNTYWTAGSMNDGAC